MPVWSRQDGEGLLHQCYSTGTVLDTTTVCLLHESVCKYQFEIILWLCFCLCLCKGSYSLIITKLRIKTFDFHHLKCNSHNENRVANWILISQHEWLVMAKCESVMDFKDSSRMLHIEHLKWKKKVMLFSELWYLNLFVSALSVQPC